MGPAKTLLPFVREIFSYQFKDRPNYSKLKHFLNSVILNHNVAPDSKFDWSKFKVPRTRISAEDENGREEIPNDSYDGEFKKNIS